MKSHQQTSIIVDKSIDKSNTKQLTKKLNPQENESKLKRNKKLKSTISKNQAFLSAINSLNGTSQENSQITSKTSSHSLKNIFRENNNNNSSREDDSKLNNSSRITLVPINSILINEKLNSGTTDLFVFVS